MIINTSRYIMARTCWRRTFNVNHRRLTEGKTWALTDGAAVHAGIATGLATGNWDEAVRDALAEMDKIQAENPFRALEFGIEEQHRSLVSSMIELYAREYDNSRYIVLQPELVFSYPIPGSEHTCVFCSENGLYAETFEEQQRIAADILSGKRKWVGAANTPHRLMGRCDAIVQKDGEVWLFEHKTTSIMNEGFWSQWLMDIQPRAYLWAIWKMLGIMPRGFVLNAVFKPSERQLANWNAKRRGSDVKSAEDYMKFESREFYVSPAEIKAVEHKFIELGDEWEWRLREGKFPLSDLRNTCFVYNRPCSFVDLCRTEAERGDLDAPLSQFVLRPPDYVEVELYGIQAAPDTVSAGGMMDDVWKEID